MGNIQFFTFFIENKYKNVFTLDSNLNHVNEPNVGKDFDIDYYTCNRKD